MSDALKRDIWISATVHYRDVVVPAGTVVTGLADGEAVLRFWVPLGTFVYQRTGGYQRQMILVDIWNAQGQDASLLRYSLLDNTAASATVQLLGGAAAASLSIVRDSMIDSAETLRSLMRYIQIEVPLAASHTGGAVGLLQDGLRVRLRFQLNAPAAGSLPGRVALPSGYRKRVFWTDSETAGEDAYFYNATQTSGMACYWLGACTDGGSNCYITAPRISPFGGGYASPGVTSANRGHTIYAGTHKYTRSPSSVSGAVEGPATWLSQYSSSTALTGLVQLGTYYVTQNDDYAAPFLDDAGSLAFAKGKVHTFPAYVTVEDGAAWIHMLIPFENRRYIDDPDPDDTAACEQYQVYSWSGTMSAFLRKDSTKTAVMSVAASVTSGDSSDGSILHAPGGLIVRARLKSVPSQDEHACLGGVDSNGFTITRTSNRYTPAATAAAAS